MANPFADWKADQQCIGVFAADACGLQVGAISPRACKWCAAGRMIQQRVSRDLQVEFFQFMSSAERRSVYEANDICHWTPAQFADAWTRFEASK